MGEVYCLYSTRDGLPRYVECTEYTAEKANRRCITKALDKEEGSVFDWTRNEWREGHEVNTWVIQHDVLPSDLEMYKQYWSDQLKTYLNTGSGVTSSRTTEVGDRVIRDIAAYLKGNND